jgi:hypothetical protein
MTKTTQQLKPRSWTRAWAFVTFVFAAVLFSALAMEWDPVQAQETKAKKNVQKKGDYTPKTKNLPVAKSLTNGAKVDTAALTKIIDQEINKRIVAEKAKSSGLCDDAEFIRRIYLDLVGTIPTADKVSTFLASKEPDKRAKLIEELLADSRFGSYLAEMWAIHLVPRESNNRALVQKPLETWLADHFNKNTPLNQTVSELLTATGEIDKNPAGIYFVANPTVDKITDNATRMFLGVQLQCAQCHNHPFTDWKQTEYWAMAAFFVKTKVSGTPQQAAKKGVTLAVSEAANAKAGKKGALPESYKNVPAKFLQGEQPTMDASGPARPTLAKWMTSADNKFFARAMVNRFWHQMFGRGLVNPVDDMHDDNAATHPELLATLTEQFKLSGFDVKFLLRAICNSEAYQRSSVSSEDLANIDMDLYSRREMRVLNPEQLFDSLTTVLGQAAKGGDPKDKPLKKGPVTPREGFINFFRVEDMNPLEYQNGIPQALRMMNSPFTNKTDVIAAQITASAKTPNDAIEKIYLTALARRPNTQELERLNKYVARPGATARVAYGDILWVLLNSSEFSPTH